MAFCPVCLGILPYSWQNTSRDITCEQLRFFTSCDSKRAGENTLLSKSAEKKHPHKLRMFAHKKTMLPIYRKNHIWSFASRSPDLSSSLQNPFPDWLVPFQWSIMFCSSLSQWRDRTGFTPVSLLICPKSTFQSRRIFRQNLQRLVQNQQMLFIYTFIIYYIFFHV